MSVCLTVGRRSHTRALVGCGRWKSVGPDCPSHYRWSTPAESGHINRTAHLSFLLVSLQCSADTCPEAVKRLSQHTLPLAGCSGTAASDASPRTLLVGDERFR
ncbi:unnamed protein product [Leuciscus chuanchicus]